jgi:hypothetical protein
LNWREDGKNMVITIPPTLLNKPVGRHAVTFRITTKGSRPIKSSRPL